MIRATIRKNGFRIEGHANYAPSGYDIVCASVSALVATTLITAYGIVDENEIEPGVVDVTYQEPILYGDKVLMRALTKGLHFIHEQYPQCLVVKHES